MRLASKLTFALILSLAACGKGEEKTSGGGGASVETYFSVTNNICVLVTPGNNFLAADLDAMSDEAVTKGGSEFTAGACPNTILIEETRATVLKTCKPIEGAHGEAKFGSRTSIYNLMKTDSGVVPLSQENADEICAGLEANSK